MSKIMKLEYIEGESIADYLEKVEMFRSQMINDDYDVVLDFINELLDFTGKLRKSSLTEFRKICHDDFILDIDHVKTTLLNNHKHLKNIIIDVNSKKVIKKMTDVNLEKYLFCLIKKILNKINYTFNKRTFSSGFHYYIKLRK
jgi:hypothetical protein